MNNLSRYNYYLQTLTDLICIVISFFCAFYLKPLIPFGMQVDIHLNHYINLLLVSAIAYFGVNMMVIANEDIMNKSFSDELRSVVKTAGIVFACIFGYVFAVKADPTYSRVFVYLFAIIFVILDLILRNALKALILPLYQKSNRAERIIIVGSYANAVSVAKRMKKSSDWRFKLAGIAATDREGVKGTYVNEVKVLYDAADSLDSLYTEPADSFLLVPDAMDQETIEFVEKLTAAGRIVHINIGEYDILSDSSRTIDAMGGCAVISYMPLRNMSRRNAFLKRSLDLLFSLIFLPVYLVVYLLSALFITVESRGPVIVHRIRVAKNGRRFYERRFRIVRMDAEERYRQGKSPFTLWGSVLHFLHMDGMPELINILGGDMSFCGPKAPTLAEYLAYSPEKRKNLCINPGAVGIWSCESKEEDAVRKERDYAENWSLTKDVMIILEMILRYVSFHSTRKYTKGQLKEEIAIVNDYIASNQPLEYDHSAYEYKNTFKDYVYLFIKRLLDIVFSAAGIVVCAIVLLILSLLVMADDGGSPIYRHERVGKDGKKIRLLKFRSMKQEAGDLKAILTPEQYEQYQREFKIDDDPRITRIGSFIRSTSLDELPQLFNILKGDISFVGPRPIVEEETKVYGDDVAKFLSVKPGLTGYWQAYARNNATYETGERQAMEMYYVDHRSLWFDIKIFFHTFGAVIRKEGAQ